MSTTNTFQPVSNIRYAGSLEAFRKVARTSPKNNCLFQGSVYNPENPLQYIDIGLSRPTLQYYYIQAEDGEILAAAFFMDSPYPDSNDIWFDAVSTRPEHRNKGYAKSLLWTVMKHAHDQGKALMPTRFMEQGWRYLAPAFTKLHALFPSLVIKYDKTPSSHTKEFDTVNGEIPYSLRKNSDSGTEVVFETTTATPA